VENQNEPVAKVASPAKGRVSMVRILIISSVIAVVLGLLIHFSPHFLIHEDQPPAYPLLQMGGTSSVFVIVENAWKGKYRDQNHVLLAYESSGSTTGVTRLLDGTYMIAFTHGPLSQEQRQQAREKGNEILHFPVLFCGVVPVYNVKELKGKAPLQLTGELLADIFLGKITEWNDPALKAVNPGVELPATKITVVHRQDSSGTTQIFTEYLSEVSGAWRDRVGRPASEVKWPVGEAGLRNLGVAMLVDKTEGAIGYVDRVFASYEEIELDYAAMQNKDKTGFVRGDPANMAAAAASIDAGLSEDLTFNLANRAGKEAYPISGVIFAVCYQNQPEPTRQRVVEFLRWATHEGQPHAAKMAYAPLLPELVKRIDQKLETIKAVP
jgi:phosphate transport system substrate-binding protein